MFEKEAEEISKDIYMHHFDDDINYPSVLQAITVGVQKGAEFGYKLAHEEIDYLNKHWRSEEERKANEWHYVKDEGTPIHEGHYLVCLRNKNHDILDCWILFDKDVGWYSLQVRLVDIYAWKEIVLPKLPKESE